MGDTKDFSVLFCVKWSFAVIRFGAGEIRLTTMWRIDWGGAIATNIVVVKER